MVDTDIKPHELMDMNLTQYELELKKDLKRLGKNKKKLHNFLYIKNFYFQTAKSDLLLFIDVKRDWQDVPVIKAISEGEVVVDGQELFENKIERNRAEKYIFNSIYGECMVATVADFDGNGVDDCVIAIHNAYGERGANKNKIVKILDGNKESLFGRGDIHIVLSRELNEILNESRAVEEAKKEVHRELREKSGKSTGQADSVEPTEDKSTSDS